MIIAKAPETRTEAQKRVASDAPPITKRLVSARTSEVWALSRKTLKNCLSFESCFNPCRHCIP